MTFAPTPEQVDCVDKFKTGKRLRVNAYAGTGKTSTLTLLAKATPRRGTYVAFNKAIAEEAKHKFPQSVTCSTTHSLAFRAVLRRGFTTDKMTGSVNGGFLASKMGYRKFSLGDEVSISERGWGHIVSETIKSFQRSGSDDIYDRHVQFEGKLETIHPKLAQSLKDQFVHDARIVWEQMIDKASPMPMGHDGYLKLYALTKPTIDGDYILLDEAQDTNGVVMEMMRHQKAQLVCVGDRHQSIYEWRGARNAMVELPCDLETRLSTSFRFGPNVAAYATEVLRLLSETVPLKGNPSREDRLGPVENPRAILARTNAAIIEEAIRLLDQNIRPHIIGGTTELMQLVEATQKLEAGTPTEFPLMFFGFKDWQDVLVTSSMPDCSQELRKWVNLVSKYGSDGLRNALSRLSPKEDGAPIVLSSGHKSKGREWPTVKLSGDFLLGVSTKTDEDKKEEEDGNAGVKPMPDAELRLFYVAATRGQEAMEVDPIATERLGVLKERFARIEEAKAKALGRSPSKEPKQGGKRDAA